jgi:DNA-directed RNA polymerase subunit E'/Rpb7
VNKVDGIVANVNKMGFFADVGPLQVFVSAHVGNQLAPCSFSHQEVGAADHDEATISRIGLGVFESNG